MGSYASKSAPSSSSSSSSAAADGSGGGGGRRARSKAHRVLQSSCLGTTSRSRHCNDNGGDQGKENGTNVSSRNIAGTESRQEKIGCYGKVKVGQSDEIPSNPAIREWGQASLADTTASTIGSSSSSQSANPSNRFLSRFSFVPGNMSFRLSRANSLGSSGSYPINNEDDRRRGNEQIPVINRGTPSLYCEEDSSGNLRLNSRAGFSIDSRDDRESSYTQDVVRNGSSLGPGIAAIPCSPRNNSETESAGVRVSSREPSDRNVRFSRTLSVGRLRDRVLRRSSISDASFCPVPQVGEARDADPGSGTRLRGSQTRAVLSEVSDDVVASSNLSGFPSSNVPGSLFGLHDYELETPRSREPRYHDLLEHRSNFLERRRRIRSQVRALQRLGSRFENLSGHERTCILSGQYRTGRCTCRASSRDPHLNDDTSARASISRIVMLAEALFEVLDEIHQQSVVLSSRPSVSSIGSVPAPSEVVESLPVKLYTKLQKHQHEEVPQCYICLVEYEEGDRMRILPCHHDFHKTCVDKWLKEIHRVCPLCRGDICRSDSLPAEN